MLEVWESLPSLLINVIFASLFLGSTIPSLKTIWEKAGPQITFSHLISWGQYVIGISLSLLILTPVFGVNPAAGALLEISFIGGHGTAAGLSSTFSAVDFEEGYDLAVGLATVGVLTGVMLGIAMINWGVRKGKTEILQSPDDLSTEQKRGLISKDNLEDEPAGHQTTRPEFIETLTVHFAYIGIAIAIGYVLLEGLTWVEAQMWGDELEIFAHLPLFPLAMIGAVIVQLLLDRFTKHPIIERRLITRVQGFALDLLIVSAISTLSLSVLGEYFLPFVLMSVAAISWTVFAFFILAPRIMPDYWFERAIGDFGQAMGLSAAGLLLIKLVDANDQSPAKEGFSYKQLLLDLVVGGGLVTAVSVPLIVAFGPIPLLIIAVIVSIGWLLLGLFYFGRKEG